VIQDHKTCVWPEYIFEQKYVTYCNKVILTDILLVTEHLKKNP